MCWFNRVDTANESSFTDCRWCQHPPYSMKCYFEAWSPCEGYYAKLFGFDKLDAISASNITGEDRVLTADRFVQAHHVMHYIHFGLYETINVVKPDRGQLFHFAMASKIIANPLPWVVHQARAELNAHGVGDNAFIVAHIRHGHKWTEQALVDEATFQKALVRLCACFKTRHVLVVTEDPNSVDVMKTWGKDNNYNVFATEYLRRNSDVWSPGLLSQLDKLAGKNNTAHAQTNTDKDNMDVEGYMAVLNLVMSRQAIALVGTMMSNWAAFTAAMMYAHHGKPVPILGLAPLSGKTRTPYGVRESEYYVEGVDAPFTWKCPSDS
jgi:hypothetical protein